MKLAIESYSSFKVAQQLYNGQELLSALATEKQKPDIILLDLEMPVLSGFVTMPLIMEKYYGTKVIIVSMYYEAKMIESLVETGIRAYLPKNVGYETLIKTLEEVRDKGFYWSEAIVKTLSYHSDKKRNKPLPTAPPVARLTFSEAKILKMLCNNVDNAEIADTLSLSIRTVEKHRSSLLKKTGSKNLLALVLYAQTHNLI